MDSNWNGEFGDIISAKWEHTIAHDYNNAQITDYEQDFTATAQMKLLGTIKQCFQENEKKNLKQK